MLTIEKIEVVAAALPMRRVFRHALSERKESDGVFVKLDGGGRAGYGEALPRSYVTGETAKSACAALRAELAPLLLGSSFPTFAAVTAWITTRLEALARDRHAAFCALELALLDLAGKVFGCPAGDVLGPVRVDHVAYDAVISADGPEAVRALCDEIRRAEILRVKVKVGRPDAAADDEVLRIVRRELGPSATLRVDANGAFDAPEASRRLQAWAPHVIAAVEQPVAAADRAGLAWLTARSPVRVFADESLASHDDAAALIRERACHGFNLRVSKCGGLVNTARIHALARRAGIATMLGAQVGESAILSAAGRQVATRLPDLEFLEGSYGRLLLEQDVAVEDLTIGRGGAAPALTGPGLGITIDERRWRELVGSSSTSGNT